MKHATFDAVETKADQDGSFVALASVFGNVDSVGDRMMPGSFSKTLEKWREGERPIPVVYSHEWDDPFKFIGKADPHRVVETERGLEVHGQLDLENDTARQVHKLMKDGTVTGWSFGYKPVKQKRANGANEVSEVELYEVGPTLVGANADAQLQTVKAALEHAEEAAIPPEMFVKQLRALADAVEARNSPMPPKDERGPEGEEPTRAKPARQVPLRRQVRRMLLDAEFRR